MKTSILMAVGLLSSILTTKAQLTLNPGDTWTYHFVPQTNWSLFQFQGGPTANGRFCAFTANNSPAGTVMRYEMFEGTTNGSALLTGYFTSAPPNTITGWVANAWQDTEGSIRFTTISGSVTITNIMVELDKPNYAYVPPRWNYFRLDAVPRPLPPRLNILVRSNVVELSWWTNVASGYVLESTNVVSGNSWVAVTQSPTILNGKGVLTTSNTGQAAFFRLRK
jgi:hypothetical protein